ncbi:MAG: glycosyltransferase [Candidatus Paceibacteria bacterium]
MKLLIITQIVDSDDPILGFFTRWIEEFAKNVEHVEVICLKEGKHTLPENVRVHSLGKERGVSRATYIFNFYKYIWKFRHDYDAVFVHMNPVYVILGGFFWRSWHKRISLWYTHKHVDSKLEIAVMLSNTIFTASKKSFRLESSKVHVMGHGIDTDFFSPDPNLSRGTAVLSAGRLSRTKRHDLVIRAAEYFPNEVRIAGGGPERELLEALAEHLSIAPRVHFLGPQTQVQLREEYRTAGVFVHVSETGSLDKVILESLACGLPVITTNADFSDFPVTVVSATPEAIAEKVVTLRKDDTGVLAGYVQKHHSLQRLIPALLHTI